jgi:predicted P-loop ATPase
VDVEGIAADRPQLFAEAVARFRAGESWWEMPVEETLAQQQARFNLPALTQPIEHFINSERIVNCDGSVEWKPRQQALSEMAMADVLTALDVPKAQWQGVEKIAAKALRSLGWDNRPVKVNGQTVRVWRLKKATLEPAGGDAT